MVCFNNLPVCFRERPPLSAERPAVQQVVRDEHVRSVNIPRNRRSTVHAVLPPHAAPNSTAHGPRGRNGLPVPYVAPILTVRHRFRIFPDRGLSDLPRQWAVNRAALGTLPRQFRIKHRHGICTRKTALHTGQAESSDRRRTPLVRDSPSDAIQRRAFGRDRISCIRIAWRTPSGLRSASINAVVDADTFGFGSSIATDDWLPR